MKNCPPLNVLNEKTNQRAEFVISFEDYKLKTLGRYNIINYNKKFSSVFAYFIRNMSE